MYRLAAILLMLASSAALGAERTVWQIGKPDHDYAEFAFAGNYQAYAEQVRRASRWCSRSAAATPARDWPFIQPGPDRCLVAGRGQPWTIRFTLPDEPRGRVHAADRVRRRAASCRRRATR